MLIGNRTVTYGKFFEDAFSFASYLKKLKIKKKSKIIINFDNSYEYILSIMSCLIGGYIACPLNNQLENITT